MGNTTLEYLGKWLLQKYAVAYLIRGVLLLLHTIRRRRRFSVLKRNEYI